MGDAFASLAAPTLPTEQVSKGKGKTRKFDQGMAEEEGPPRNYLKMWETAPAQWLQGGGMSLYSVLQNEELWKRAAAPLKYAIFGTELADTSEDRRGVGINRALLALSTYVEYM